MNRTKTQEIYSELCQVLPGGVNSPVRACYAMKQLPMIVDYGYGDRLVDVDGHTYIDYCCSWGALIHGHAHPSILEAVQRRMIKGTSFGITTMVEKELACEVVKLVDSVEKIRFVSSGTEATMSAVRLARSYTQRDWIIKFNGNYHGHADFFLVQAGSGVVGLSPTSSSAGIPDEIVKYTISLPYNDEAACEAIFNHPDYKDKIAAVILEPIACNMGVVPASQPFIHFLREETQRIGALLIFDEVITGFRVGLKGAQHYYGVQADLTCFGKIIGGGFPAAAFGGREEIMNQLAPLGSVYQAGTLSGNPIAMEGGLQALRLLQQPGFYENLQLKTERLLNPILSIIKEKQLPICIQQVGSMFTFFFGRTRVENLEEAKQINSSLFIQFFQYLFSKGIYIPPSPHEAWFISSAHTNEHIDYTAKIITNFLNDLN